MKTQRVILTLLAVTFVLAPQLLKTASAKPHGYSARLLSPRPGEILRPGDVVKVQWSAVFPPGVELDMCEAEILLSVDGGRTFQYVTEQRNPKLQTFNWTVPNTPTTSAILDIRFGCLGIYAETTSIQAQSAFVISPLD